MSVVFLRLLNTFFELYFSHSGRTWSIFNMIPFLWLRFSLWLFKHSVRPRNRDEDFLLLHLLKISCPIAAASCCTGLILGALRCCHNSINKLNITVTPSVLASDSPSLMVFALHDGILTAFRAFVVMFTHIETFFVVLHDQTAVIVCFLGLFSLSQQF
jgi:hypothetical protein